MEGEASDSRVSAIILSLKTIYWERISQKGSYGIRRDNNYQSAALLAIQQVLVNESH